MARSTLQADYDEALEDIASVKSTLTDAYSPESTRTELAAAIGEALTQLEDYETEEEEPGEAGGDED